MHAFDVLGDPIRRRILELLADGELSSGAITAVIQAEFGISQPAVSQHLKVLRDSGFANVRPDGTRRLYAVDAEPLRGVDDWLDHFRGFWSQRLDSLATELARGRRERRLRATENDPGGAHRGPTSSARSTPSAGPPVPRSWRPGRAAPSASSATTTRPSRTSGRRSRRPSGSAA